MYDMNDIQTLLGSKFDPKAEYVISTHREAHKRKALGWKQVAELPDATPDQSGTVLVLERKSSQRKAG